MNAVPETPRLPLSSIHPSKSNPRHFFDKSLLNEMAESIKKDDVIQPIVVRPIDDGYEIVAGERRYRASKLAGLETIPVTIKDLDDEAAIRWATKENLERENMSVIEESYAAQTAMTLVDGDRAAACSILSWTEQKLNKRLMLLNLCKKGQTALMKKKINIGHAELLATLAEDMQVKAIESVIEKNITVAELKSKLAEFAYQLSTAIFSTKACNGCPNNSSTQCSLFEESVGEGQCMNPVCYEQKQESKLQYIKKAKEEDYNVVYLDVERTKDSYNYLQVATVGEKQFGLCQQCDKCGALISTRHETLGSTDEDVCFDTVCYEKKVKAIKQKDDAPTRKASTVAKPSAKKPVKAGADAESNKPPKKVLEYKDQLNRKMVARELVTDAHLMLCMNAVILCEALPSLSSDSPLLSEVKAAFKLKDVDKFSSYQREENIKKLYALSDDALHGIIAYATTLNAAGTSNSDPDKAIASLLDILKPEMAEHFLLDEAFMRANPKKGMIALLKEAQFDSWYNMQKGKPDAFEKMVNGKIDDIIEVVLKSEFALKGFVPEALHYAGYINRVRGNAHDTQKVA